jgi:hypothetical protein
VSGSANNDGPNAERPLRLILEVREEVVQALTRYEAARQGLYNGTDKDELVKKWHVRVMAYYHELKRYRHSPNIENLWRRPIKRLDDMTPENQRPPSLEDLQQYQLQDYVAREDTFDPESRATVTEEVTKPYRFGPRQLLAITDRLDRCASELGFDVTPSTPTPDDADSDYDDLEYE